MDTLCLIFYLFIGEYSTKLGFLSFIWVLRFGWILLYLIWTKEMGTILCKHQKHAYIFNATVNRVPQKNVVLGEGQTYPKWTFLGDNWYNWNVKCEWAFLMMNHRSKLEAFHKSINKLVPWMASCIVLNVAWFVVCSAFQQ